MRRLPVALLCALSCHGLLILLPFPKDELIVPRMPGDDTIKISLARAVAVESEVDVSDGEQSESQEDSNLKQEEVKAIVPPKKMVQQANTPVKQTPEPVQSKKKSPADTPQPSQAFEEARVATAVPVTVRAKPLYHRNPKPVYPGLARRRGWQGIVILAVTVLEDGSAGQVALHKSSGYKLLDTSALKAVNRWHFLPGTENGRPEPMEILIPIHFILD